MGVLVLPCGGLHVSTDTIARHASVRPLGFYIGPHLRQITHRRAPQHTYFTKLSDSLLRCHTDRSGNTTLSQAKLMQLTIPGLCGSKTNLVQAPSPLVLWPRDATFLLQIDAPFGTAFTQGKPYR